MAGNFDLSFQKNIYSNNLTKNFEEIQSILGNVW